MVKMEEPYDKIVTRLQTQIYNGHTSINSADPGDEGPQNNKGGHHRHDTEIDISTARSDAFQCYLQRL